MEQNHLVKLAELIHNTFQAKNNSDRQILQHELESYGKRPRYPG